MVSPSLVAMISFNAIRRSRFLYSGELRGSSQSLGRSRANSMSSRFCFLVQWALTTLLRGCELGLELSLRGQR
jgi:hypothetical protein